jgi:alkyl hydroperoxide reductase subunit AhpC
VRIEEGLERKNVRVVGIINDRNFSLAQWASASRGAVGLNGLKYIVLSDLREAAGEGWRANEIATWIGLVEANGSIAGMGMDCHGGEQQSISMNGFD